jgi:cardiolipin synthase
MEFRPGHRLRLLRDGAEAFPAILRAIAEASESVDVEEFIFTDDSTGARFVEVLGERAASGVRVRVITDRVGSFMTLRPAIARKLMRRGVDTRAFRPWRPWYAYRIGWRDHRKLVICDGRRAFVGGFCIDDRWAGDSYEGEAWRDTGLGVEGPIVADLVRLFEARWRQRRWDRVPRPPDRPAAGNVFAAVLADDPIQHPVLDFYVTVIERAVREVWIASAYFVPPRRLRDALRAAARRGVDVRILVPRHSNHRVAARAGERSYQALLEDGVRIFRWTGRMMHAKTAVLDGELGIVGSSNLDPRSLFAAHELNVAFRDPGVADTLRRMFLDDAARSEALEAAAWARRPLVTKAASALACLFRHWL